MRQFLISMVCLLGVMTTATAQEVKSNSDVAYLWEKKTIAVKGGGQTPDVMKLLKAFHNQFPTWVTEQVLRRAASLKDGEQYVSDDDYRVLVDRRNGYVDLASETDIDQMQACVWKRKNGHRLFAVSLYDQHDPVPNVLCWYDYDPETETLKSERSPRDEFREQHPHAQLGWNLPLTGTDFELMEYDPLFPNLTHVYTWDGMRHHEAKTRIEDFRYQCFADDDWLQASEQGFLSYALFDPTNCGSPILCLRKAPAQELGEAEYALFAEFKGDMQMVGCDGMMYLLNDIFQPKPEDDAPWTKDDVVVYTSDFMHTHYYAVLDGNNVQYFVIDEPFEDEDQHGYEPRIIGYGTDKESIHIVHASVAKKIAPTLRWHDFEFVEEAP